MKATDPDVRDVPGVDGLLPVEDPAGLRRAFGCFPSGVVAVCALTDAGPVGLAASSFTTVSLRPPQVAVCAQHTSSTWPTLRAVRRVGISVLAEDHAEVSARLSAKGVDRFAGTEWFAGPGGSVFVAGAVLQLDCSVHIDLSCGDHDVVVYDVHRVHATPGVAPLVFHTSRYRALTDRRRDRP